MDNLSLFTLLLACVTFLLALAAFWAIWQNHSLQKRERKERLLNEIIEWVIEIQKVSLEIDIPVTSATLSKERIDAGILLRYGIPFIKNSYIKEIVYKEFKDDLMTDVENMIVAFTAFMFCSAKCYGIKDEDIKKSFRGTSLERIEDVEERLKEKSVQKLWIEYAEEKAKYTNIILTKVGDIMASL